MTNYEPMWAVVDGLRQVSDLLENWTREQTGDQPAPEAEVDLISLHDDITMTLREAASALIALADRDGSSVTHAYANKCRVIARRCERVIEALDKAGEL